MQARSRLRLALDAPLRRGRVLRRRGRRRRGGRARRRRGGRGRRRRGGRRRRRGQAGLELLNAALELLQVLELAGIAQGRAARHRRRRQWCLRRLRYMHMRCLRYMHMRCLRHMHMRRCLLPKCELEHLSGLQDLRGAASRAEARCRVRIDARLRVRLLGVLVQQVLLLWLLHVLRVLHVLQLLGVLVRLSVVAIVRLRHQVVRRRCGVRLCRHDLRDAMALASLREAPLHSRVHRRCGGAATQLQRRVHSWVVCGRRVALPPPPRVGFVGEVGIHAIGRGILLARARPH